MFCPECGKKVKEGISFCPECGAKISSLTGHAPKPSLKSSNRIILFLVAGLILIGLAVGGFFYWQKTKESKELEGTETIGEQKEKSEKSTPSPQLTISEPLITANVVGLSLSQEDVGSSLKFDYADPRLNLEDEPGLADGLNQAIQVKFNNQKGESNLVNLVLRYSSIETAKKAYDFAKNDIINQFFGGTDVPKVPAETLTTQKFGNDSVVYKVVMPEEEGTVIICLFRRGNIIEMIAPTEQPLTESDVYKYARILEEKINKAAASASDSSESPQPTPTSSISERIEKANDRIVKANITLIQIGLNRYFTEKDSYPKSLEELKSGGYLEKIPVDPRTKEPYDYQSDGKGFTLSGKLSDGSEYKVSQ